MGLLLIDGFERYSSDATGLIVPEGHLFSDISAPLNGRVRWQIQTGRLGYGSSLNNFRFSSSSGTQGTTVQYLRWKDKQNVTFINGRTYTVGFGFRMGAGGMTATSFQSGNPVLINFGGIQLIRTRIDNSNYRININGVNYGDNLTTGFWYYIEIQWTQGNPVTLVLKINGNQIINQSGLNLSANPTLCSFSGSSDEWNGDIYSVDDFYLLDNTGDVNTTFLGPQKIEYLVPVANGSVTQFIPTTGQNWENVDEVNILDNNVVTSNSIGSIDYYQISLNNLNSSNINGIAMNIVGNSTGLGCSIVPRIKNGNDIISGNEIVRNDQQNRGDNFCLVSDTAPDGTIWDATKLNASEIGFIVTALPPAN